MSALKQSGMQGKQLDDKDLIKSLGPGQRQELTKRSDYPALLDLALHAAGLIVLSLLIMQRVPLWPLLLLLHGILLVFLFTVFHETTHETAFKTRALNIWVNRLCGFILFIPPLWFKYFHLAHHRHTQDPDLDPELATPKPENRWQYLFYISGLPTQWYLARTLLNNVLLRENYHYVPKSAVKKIQSETQIMLLLYGAVFYIVIELDPAGLLTLWLLPLLVGQPFLRLYLLAEHTLCPRVASMSANTRTTLTTTLVRRLAWNMPFHAEHHLMPTVPYHKLAEFHQMVKSNLKQLETGYIPFHQRMLERLK